MSWKKPLITGDRFTAQNRGREEGSVLVKTGIFLVAVLFGLYTIFLVMFGYAIHPGEIGLRQIKFGPWQGFSDRPLLPGIHWGLPGDFYTVVYKMPQTIQQLDFNRDRQASPDSLESLEIQTSDRATVDVDATILTRFYDSTGTEREPVYGDGVNMAVPIEEQRELKHGGPRDLIKGIGPTPTQWRNHIQRTAEDELKRALGAISTAEFYDPQKREVQIAVAHRNMNRSLARHGIRVEAVLLRRYTYRDKRIDNAIFQKNLQDQEERLNLTASTLAQAQAELEQVAAEWDAQIQTAQVEGQNKAKVVRSEGELYEAQRKALGDLELARARAEVDRLRAQALASAPGAQNYVSRELAGILASLRGGVVSDIDPYDLDAWIKKLGSLPSGQNLTATEGR